MNAPLPFALWSRDAPLVPNVPPDSPAAAAAASALGMSFASDSGPAPAPAAITAPFRCTEPNCAKAFQRKEHLTRHVRSNHIAGRPHQCHICNRSFARSDILKRHVAQHSSNAPPKRTLVACQTCHRRKLKCDMSTPCKTCSADGVDCLRKPHDGPSKPIEDVAPGPLSAVSVTTTATTSTNDGNGTQDSNAWQAVPISWSYPGPTDPVWTDDIRLWDEGAGPARPSPVEAAAFDAFPNLSPLDGTMHAGHFPYLATGTTPTSMADFPPRSTELGGGPIMARSTIQGGHTPPPAPPASEATPSSGGHGRGSSGSNTGGTNTPPSTPGGGALAPREGSRAPREGTGSYPSSVSGREPASATGRHRESVTHRPSGNTTPRSRTSPDPDLGAKARLAKVEDLLRSELSDVCRMCASYSAAFHPHWPILHVPTFKRHATPDILLSVLAAIGSWCDGLESHDEIARIVHQDLHTVFLPSITRESSWHSKGATETLPALQALLLMVVFETISAKTRPALEAAIHLHGIMISVFRQLEVFSNHRLQGSSDPRSLRFDRWLLHEQRKRLAFAALRIDAYLCVITGDPPLLRHQEIQIPLPVSDRLWNEHRAEDRRTLLWSEPAGREQQTFGSLLRNALVSYGRSNDALPLYAADYHLGLCALQSGFWDATQELHRCDAAGATPDLAADADDNEDGPETFAAPPRPAPGTLVWRRHLALWRRDADRVAPPADRIARPPDLGIPKGPAQVLPAIGRTMFHLSGVRLHADLPLLQGKRCCFDCGGPASGPGSSNGNNNEPSHHAAARTALWAQSRDARTAVLHAAQLRRVLSAAIGGDQCSAAAAAALDSSVRMNPLFAPAVLASCVVLCAYARHARRSCTRCLSGGIVNSPGEGDGDDTMMVDDGAAHPETEEAFELAPVEADVASEASGQAAWIEHGGPAALLGGPLCACRVCEIVGWHRWALGRGAGAHAHASEQLELFLVRLAS